MEPLEGALDVGLVAASCLMLLALEFGVLDVVFAELAPVFGLCVISIDQIAENMKLTVDFQYSDMAAGNVEQPRGLRCLE